MASGSSLRSPALAALGLDLESTLNEEPHFLLDVCFLGALHSELVEHLGCDEAHATLFQLGLLHGLRDAALVLRAGFGGSPLELPAASPATPRLAIRLAPNPAVPADKFEIRGSWPERHEAEAYRTAVGSGTCPTCYVSSGYTSGWLSGIFDSDVLAVEVECSANGDAACQFIARETAVWRDTSDPRISRLLDGLPFPAFRQLVARHLESTPEPDRQEAFEAGAAVVHVWGPVMVIPFSSPEESLHALELIGRDPGARDVRVVIIDLSGAIIDEGFGAVALEQILDAIERWGAEPILAGISPLSARIIEDMERTHLVIHKDLPEAIAAGFQIADLHRVAS
jgi:anti-anti-sigma regulatory factor